MDLFKNIYIKITNLFCSKKQEVNISFFKRPITKKFIFVLIAFFSLFIISCLLQLFDSFILFKSNIPDFNASQRSNFFKYFVGKNYFFNHLFIVSALSITLVQVILICIIGDFWIGIGVFGIIYIIVCFVNILKLKYRGEAFLPSDILFAADAGELQSMIDIKYIFYLVLLLLFYCAFIFTMRFLYKKYFIRKFFKNGKIFKHSILYRTTLSLLLIVVLIFLLKPATFCKSSAEASYAYSKINNLYESRKINGEYPLRRYPYRYASSAKNYFRNGLFNHIVMNLIPASMEKPNGYNENLVKSIVEKYKNIKSEDKSETNILLKNEIGQTPDIVYILEESMIDVNDVKEQFPYSGPNPNAYLEKLMSESISGRMSSFVYGGGTAKVEFEALTSFSNYFLNEITPYSIFANNKNVPLFPGITSYFAQKNYETTAIHPYNYSLYNRKECLPKLQFSKMIDETQMKYDNNDFVGNYLSDEFAFNEAYNRLNDSTNNKFMFLITMQNHVPFVYEGGDIKLTNSNSKSINTYYNELLKTDKAIKTFIEKLKKRKKETIVLIFGDHLPMVFDSINGSKSVKKWQTPFAIWDNLGKIKPQNIGAVSPIYFNEILWSLFDKKQRPTFYYLLKSLKEKQPVLNATIHSKIPKLYPITKDQVLEDYKIIEYDMLYGNRYSLKFNFFNSR